jgi:hypothetical protein
MLYCHCRSCRTAHAAPLVAAAIFQAAVVTYTGEVLTTTVTEGDGATRRLVCARCGTRVLNEPPPPVRAIFPALCETTDWFRATMHVNWQERVVDVRDDLPKFIDFPSELGGSGETA